MILDEIVFQNYGVYRGRQSVKLAPPASDKPIVLIGALNGGGKTTFLDGLQLALFGKNAHCSNRGELGYDDFLRRCIHRGVQPQEGASIQLSFRHASEGSQDVYQVHREWHENGKGLKEEVRVLKNGEADDLLSEHWSEHVETFFPHGISDLFFFDGEKIEQLADISRAARALSTAIHSLLGIELVDRLASDLIVLERRKKTVVHSDNIRKKIVEFDEDIRRLEELRELTLVEQAAAQNALDLNEKALKSARDKFRIAGGDLFLKRQEIEGERARLIASRDEMEMKLRDLAATAMPFLLVDELICEVIEQMLEEERADEAKVLLRLLKGRDAKILARAKKAGAAKAVIEAIERFCEEDLDARLATGKSEGYLRLSAETRMEILDLHQQVLPNCRQEGHSISAKLQKLKEQINHCDQALAAVPDTEAIETLRSDLEETEKSLLQAKAKVENMEARLRQLAVELDRKRASREGLLMSDIDEQVRHLDSIRTIQHAERVRGTLQQFRVRVVQRHVERIEKFVLESITQLLRKKSLISDIKIDPATYSLQLFGSDGKPITSERLSAGERQLLAVSMLWGLAKASGRMLPTVIDTPLGRLDTEHRTHLVDRYFPHASHQVILLSTNEEIDEAFVSKLKPRIGHSYHLRFEDKTASTIIEPGYFRFS